MIAKLKEIMAGVKKAFEAVVGQLDGKRRAEIYFEALAQEGETRSQFVKGRTGLGKTHFMDALVACYRASGFDIVRVGCPTELLGAPFALLAEKIRTATSANPLAIAIDECHRMVGRVQLARLKTFIMLHSDDRNIGKPISINDGEIGVSAVDRASIVFILATNFPSKMEEGKQSTSFADRMMQFELDDYTHPEIVEILSRMIEVEKLRLHPGTIKTIADCARGTARPLQEITKELVQLQKSRGTSSHVLNKTEVLEAIKLAKHFPYGLTKTEVQFLDAASVNCVRQNVMIQRFPNLETSAIRKSLAYLQAERTNGEGEKLAAFLHLGPKGYATTETGKKYLASIAKLGFHW